MWSVVLGQERDTIVVSPACFAASIRASVTVLRQSTHVPKTSKKRAFRWVRSAMVSALRNELDVQISALKEMELS